jgi:hypothetical protein
MIETKTFRGVEFKAGDTGAVVARFATLGVIDLDGDIIPPGAIGVQRVKVSAYGHSSTFGGNLPVGRGATREDGDQALADLQFFMTTNQGKDHFETIKLLEDLGEWSFGYEVLEWAAPSDEQRQCGCYRILKKLRVFEVSPVMEGAGIGTQTISAKSAARKAAGLPEDAPIAATETTAVENPPEQDPALAAGDPTLEEPAATVEPEDEDEETDAVLVESRRLEDHVQKSRALDARLTAERLAAELAVKRQRDDDEHVAMRAELGRFEQTRKRLGFG